MLKLVVEGARVLALVDTLLARARFARDYDCVAPPSRRRFALSAARHPLLESTCAHNRRSDCASDP